MVLRTLLSQRRRALGVAEAIERVEKALERLEADAPPGGPWGVQVQLPRDATCGTVARRLLDEYVHDHLSERAAGDALLVIERLGDRLRIEVLDGGEPRRIGPGSLSATSEMSLAWGAMERGSHVWAEDPVV